MITYKEADAIKSTFNRLLTLRAAEDYQHKHDKTTFSQSQVASPNLRGNLGTMLLVSNENYYGENLIASSASTKNDLEEYFVEKKLPVLILKAVETGQIWFEDPATTQWIYFEPKYKSKKTHDSEYILINALDRFLRESKIVKGELYLVTERIPCAQCTQVILEFQKDYSQININIYYLFDTSKEKKGTVILRNSKNFKNEIGNSPIKLYFCFVVNDLLYRIQQ